MPDVLLTASFVALLSQLRPVFTAPSFANFVVLLAGMVHALGAHRLTDALRAAGPAAERHFTSYYRFLSHAQWSLDELGLALLALIEQVLSLPELELIVDDTLCRRSGKKVALATMHADPLLKQGGRPFHSYGHVFVVLAVHVRLPLLAPTGWALPVMFRLFEGPRQGGRKDAASDARRRKLRRDKDLPTRNRVRKTDRKVVDGRVEQCAPEPDSGPLPKELHRTKTQLAAELILAVARRFPHLRIRVLADHLYNCNAVLNEVLREVDNVNFVTRGRPDAALFAMPEPRKPGQRGRPAIKGEQLPNPKQWADEHADDFERHVVPMYGRDVTVRVASYLGMAYRSLPGRLVRYVIVIDPAGIYRTDYLLCTDLELSVAEVVAAYSRRWPLEQTFECCKQKLGMQDTQVQMPAAVRRHAPLSMLLYSLVVLWYLQHGHQLTNYARLPADPWYKGNPRPSFTNMLACLRRASWGEAFVDPPLPGTGATENQPPTTRDRRPQLARYLSRVVAAG
ncbi:MAG: transposase [Deltaproteobacteria bacterium]|nr:transposase [Deltaproteobacteria bacterium]